MKTNVAPFLVKTPRVCQNGNKIWTHAIYNPKMLYKIQNCSTMLSKVPRFPYESLTKDNLPEILCECGMNEKCNCKTQTEKEARVKNDTHYRQHIFIGPCPKAATNEGLCKSKRDRVSQLVPNGGKQHLLVKLKQDGPDFLDTEVRETTAFYRGCKWSHWTSERSGVTTSDTPGPGTYTLQNEHTESYICAEKVRFNKRKNAKQYRFVEMIQQKNLRDNLPGPANYYPKFLRGTELQFMGPKAERYSTSNYNAIPGPCDYSIKREFQLPEPVTKLCHVKLPQPSGFGVKSARFRIMRQNAPGPASYNTDVKLSHVKHYAPPPFGSSSPRFKQTGNVEELADLEVDAILADDIKPTSNECKMSSVNWMFKSNTERFKHIKKQLRDPSPADLVLTKSPAKRSLQSQNISPFCTSERRFRTWFNWIAIQGEEKTPGAGRFYLEKYICTPAFVRGPLFRSARFSPPTQRAPPCTAYTIGGETEKVLYTFNEKLKQNIKNKHQFRWKVPQSKIKLSNSEKERLLISKSIALLNTAIFGRKTNKPDKENTNSKIKTERKNKLLRCFL